MLNVYGTTVRAFIDLPYYYYYYYGGLTPTSYTIKIVGQEEDKNKRLHLEESWIHPLDTIEPRGLNLKL